MKPLSTLHRWWEWFWAMPEKRPPPMTATGAPSDVWEKLEWIKQASYAEMRRVHDRESGVKDSLWLVGVVGEALHARMDETNPKRQTKPVEWGNLSD